MYFLINELSFSSQFSCGYDVDSYMEVVKEIILEVRVLRNFELFTHQNLANCKLCSDYTVLDWLRSYLDKETKDADFIRLFHELLKKDCITQILNEELNNGLHYWECYFGNVDYFDSSLAGAAYFQGNLVSIQKSTFFDASPIVVRFKYNDEEYQEVKVLNISNSEQAKKLVPKFEYHSKHDEKAAWYNATPMDLDEKNAQEALYLSVPHEGCKRYSLYRKKYYVFHSNNTYTSDGYPAYHGYPIDDSRVPQAVIKILQQ